MSRWRQLVKPPKGALPPGVVTKAGIALIAVLVAGLLFSSSLTGPDGTEEGSQAAGPRAVDDRAGRSFEGRLRQEAERETLRAEAESRDEPADRRIAGVTEVAAVEPEGGAGGRAVGVGRAEAELREALRLEEVERRTRSLRSPPVAESHRDRGGSQGADRAPGGSVREGEEELADAAFEETLASFERSLAALDGEIAAGLASGGVPPTTAGPTSPRTPASSTRVAAEPGRVVRPNDPPGWERIREGSFLEAVLLTQLSGEFPGPALAMVSVPFHSADRQRVLIPRGARVVGTAEAVRHRDQGRLAVAFHRLLYPDGSWIDLEFSDLDQTGAAALRDQVDRHYFSTFLAAGAVGAISGLALAGAPPYGVRAGVGQGLGQSAASTLDRFLNRLPTVTIRAGHRLRIWFTADVPVPSPAARR